MPERVCVLPGIAYIGHRIGFVKQSVVFSYELFACNEL